MKPTPKAPVQPVVTHVRVTINGEVVALTIPGPLVLLPAKGEKS